MNTIFEFRNEVARVMIAVDADEAMAENKTQERMWTIQFGFAVNSMMVGSFTIERPDEDTLEDWRRLARAEPQSSVGDTDTSNGVLSTVVGTADEIDYYIFMAGTNSHPRTTTSMWVKYPVAALRAPLYEAIEFAARAGLKFATLDSDSDSEAEFDEHQPDLSRLSV